MLGRHFSRGSGFPEKEIYIYLFIYCPIDYTSTRELVFLCFGLLYRHGSLVRHVVLACFWRVTSCGQRADVHEGSCSSCIFINWLYNKGL